MIERKKILLGITGSIAAYKTASLVRLLVKAGADVKVVVTASAVDFVTPLTLSTVSKNEVLSNFTHGSSWTNHVALGRWADLMLIVPLSCNTLATMSAGLCDNLLMAVYLSATCPVIVAPAMDEDMWKHPTTKRNLRTLEGFGNRIIPPGSGELASGLFGEGRMAEPEAIVHWLTVFFAKQTQLKGKTVLVTAGPTQEAIDPVRYISNYSSGKMGIAIARELQQRGAEVKLILGPGTEPAPVNIETQHVKSARQMMAACSASFTNSDWLIMSAAVADYRPANAAEQKIKKKESVPSIILEETQDILATLGAQKRPGQYLVGFALETEHEKENALKKLASKNADMIVLNSLQDKGVGFGLSTNKVTIFDKNGGEYFFETKTKEAVAADIIDTLIQFIHE